MEKRKFQYLLQLIQQCYQNSQKNNKLLFWFSLLNEWFGLTWTGRSFFQQQQLILPRTTYRRLKLKGLEIMKNDLQQQISTSAGNIFWMDNFSKVYVTNYQYSESNVPWKLRNLTATGVFLIPKLPENLQNPKNFNLNSPLPTYNLENCRIFFKKFVKTIKKGKMETFHATNNWLKKYPSVNSAIKPQLHSSFKPLELLDFNPSNFLGCLSTLGIFKEPMHRIYLLLLLLQILLLL